jgi:hypothetical protein
VSSLPETISAAQKAGWQEQGILRSALPPPVTQGRVAFTTALEAAGVVSIAQVMTVLETGALLDRLIGVATITTGNGRRPAPPQSANRNSKLAKI